MFRLCGHFYGETGYECLHHCRLRYVYEKVKNKCVPFHIKACFALSSSGRMSRGDLIKQDGVECQEAFSVFLSRGHRLQTKITFCGNSSGPKSNKFRTWHFGLCKVTGALQEGTAVVAVSMNMFFFLSCSPG